MGTKDSQESELDVGGTGSGPGEAALPIGAERDHHEGRLAYLFCHTNNAPLVTKVTVMLL